MYKFIILIFLINLNLISTFDTNIYLNQIIKNNELKNFYLPYFNQTIELINHVLKDKKRTTSQTCDLSLNQLKNGLNNLDEWALKFYEANGKLKNGKLFGYNGDLGDFDQCLSISVDGENKFSGKYCLISIQTEESELIKKQKIYQKNIKGLSESSKFITDFSLGSVQGLCFPSTCNIYDLVNSINKLSKGIKIVPQKHCSVANESLEFNYVEIFTFAFFGLVIFLCIISTIFSIDYLEHFNLGHNFMKLYKINDSLDATTTNHLHGTKVGYMFVGIIGHCWGMLMPFAPFLYGGFKSIKFDHFTRGILDRILIGPDMMFFISGFLSMYTWYNPMRKMNIGISKYILIRYLRCLVVVGMTILGNYIWPRLGSGPYFNELAQHFHETCTKSVWKNLILINNQDRMLDICALPTWFISADFQLYLQSYLTTYFMATKPKIGFIIAAIQILVNSAYTIVDTYLNDYPTYMACSNMTALHAIDVEQQYFFTYLHSNVYVLGIICGWLVISKKQIKLSNFSVCLIWAITLTCTFSSVYLPDLWHYDLIKIDSRLLYAWPVVSRILFSAAIFWSVYSSAMGYNRVFKSILSCRFMITMSRMSMSMVTCQFFYLWYYLGTRRDLIRLTVFDLLREGILAFFICWFIGFLMYIFIEAPVVNLLYSMLGFKRRIDLNKIKLPSKISLSNENFEIKEEIKKEELDENANIKEDCKDLILNANLIDKNDKINHNQNNLYN